MNDRAGQLARNLVHVGDHQQQALRRGKRGAQRHIQRAEGVGEEVEETDSRSNSLDTRYFLSSVLILLAFSSSATF